ncbi:MAG: tRNA (adenosine(37)-N6)-threonylcarbamoyltransferase complex dimerization subunit type 1 TsaB [Caldiserica bacterium]|nr:tRNA (adenosine(37)-N6)-threonylcarbamoyltransferase complex dimerization subunit type 1 TsaB [Caldisericota bacterium]
MSTQPFLLINTATVSGVVGLGRRDGVLAQTLLKLTTASNTVVAAIDQVLAEAGCTLDDIGGIVLVKGPGTFTGSRVGASIAKAIAYAAPCSLVSVTTLEAVAWSGFLTSSEQVTGGPVWALLDARRHQFYVQEFVVREGALLSRADAVCVGPEAFDTVRAMGGLAVCAFSSAAVPESQCPLERERVAWSFDAYPSCAGILAASARARSEDPFTLEPLYLRSTEELFDLPKVTP